MNLKPEKVVIESTEDVINYVSSGKVPSKDNYNTVINAVMESQMPTPEEELSEEDLAKYYDNEIKARQQTKYVLDVVYENRRKNRKKLLMIGAGVLGLLGLSVFGAYKAGEHKSCKCSGCDCDDLDTDTECHELDTDTDIDILSTDDEL